MEKGESGPYSHIIPSCHFSFANNTEIFVILPVMQKTVCVHLCVSACVYNTDREIDLSVLIYRLIIKG